MDRYPAPVHRLVASTFGLGLIPRRLWGTDAGAGTFGAVFGAGLGWLLVMLDAPWWLSAAVAAAAFAASLWAARPYATEGDPGWICMDETAGTLVAVVGLSGWPWLAAVVVARLADIFKVLPGVTHADRLHGSFGIALDDVIAGLYGLGVGWVLVAVGV